MKYNILILLILFSCSCLVFCMEKNSNSNTFISKEDELLVRFIEFNEDNAYCNYCKITLKNSKSIKTHVRLHKKYYNIFEYFIRNKFEINKHSLFVCPNCHVSCKNPGNLILHFKKIHYNYAKIKALENSITTNPYKLAPFAGQDSMDLITNHDELYKFFADSRDY